MKVGIVVLFICTLAVLCYLVFISLKLLRKAEAERKLEQNQNSKEVKLHPKLKDRDQK